MTRTSNLVTRIYHSREDRISEIHPEQARIQYDGYDGKRLSDVQNTFDEYSVRLCDKIDDYLDSEDEDELEYNRARLIEDWAMAQAALSKIAWAMRFDGNAAYERLMNSIKTDAPVDMRGL